MRERILVFPVVKRLGILVSALSLLVALAAGLPAGAGARVAYVTGSEHEEVIITGTGGTTAAANPGGFVVPVDLGGETAGTAIPLDDELAPLGIAITPDGTRAYVADTYSEEVTPIDIATNTAGTPIPVGEYPESIAITPDGTRAYVANFGEDTVTRIDIPSGTTKEIPVGDGPSGIVITPDGTRAYVTNYFGNTVSPIDLSTDTAGTPIPVGKLPWGIAITPDGTRAYVVNAEDETVNRIDIPANTVSATIPVGQFPQLIAISPSGEEAFVIGGYHPLIPLDLTTDTAGAGIVTGNSIGGMAFMPDGSAAYLTARDEDGLRELAQPGNTLGPAFPVGERAEAIAIAPDQPPNAAFTSSPGQPEPGEEVSFDASGTTDSDGTVARYDWDFGDGETLEDGGPEPKHAYSEAGTYQVTVRTTDDEGCSTEFVFNGQTAYCNGSGAAEATHEVKVAVPEVEEEKKQEEKPAQQPPPEEKKAEAAPSGDSCAPVAGGASTFVPKLRSSHVVPGVRVRLAVGAPAHLSIEPTLLWAKGGKTTLEGLSVDIDHWRRIRIPIPASLRDTLPLGTRVGLEMTISSMPRSGSGCTATVTQKKLRVRVVKVIPDAVQAQ